MLQPTLIGQYVTLRPLRHDDFDALYAVASDPLIWEQHPAKNRYQKAVFETYFQGALDSRGAFFVVDRQSGQALGSSRYYEYEPEHNRISIGYTFLSRSVWGKEHNRDMKHLMINHAFQFVDSVHFHIGQDNLRSRRAVEKLGARWLPEADRALSDGVRVTYEIRKAQWKKT